MRSDEKRFEIGRSKCHPFNKSPLHEIIENAEMKKDLDFFVENNAAGFWEGYDRLVWISLAAISLALGRVLFKPNGNSRSENL